MKHKHFYHKLLNTTDISVEIAELDITNEERIHLLSLVDANIHSSVVSTVLSSLQDEDKKVFLQNISNNDHSKTWEHLNKSIENVETKIKEVMDRTIKELVEDVKSSKLKR